MTREEAIDFGEMWLELQKDSKDSNTYEFFVMALKALEQKPVLDKIRAEVESQRKEVSNKNSENNELQAFYDGLNDGLKDARDIIDKYISREPRINKYQSGRKMYEDKGVLEQIVEKQNNLLAINKAWSDLVEKNGYVN